MNSNTGRAELMIRVSHNGHWTFIFAEIDFKFSALMPMTNYTD